MYINPKLFIPSFFLLILTILFSQAVKSILYISHWYEFIDYTCKWYLTFVFLSLSSLTWCDYFFNTPTLLTASLFHSVLWLSGVPVIDIPTCPHFSSTGPFGGFHVLPIERVLPWKSRCRCHFEQWFSVNSASLYSSVGKESTCNARDPSSIPGTGRSAGEGMGYPLQFSWASFVAQLVKNLLAMWETWALSLGWEGPLEKRKATHSSVLP